MRSTDSDSDADSEGDDGEEEEPGILEIAETVSLMSHHLGFGVPAEADAISVNSMDIY